MSMEISMKIPISQPFNKKSSYSHIENTVQDQFYAQDKKDYAELPNNASSETYENIDDKATKSGQLKTKCSKSDIKNRIKTVNKHIGK